MNKELNIKPVKELGFKSPQAAYHCRALQRRDRRTGYMKPIKKIIKYPIDVSFAGIWNSRTRPNSFEGVGSVGLKWLKDAGFDNNLYLLL